MPADLNSSSYYRRRAAEAHRLAFAATAQGVRKVHLDMAATYERLAEEAEPVAPRPTLRVNL